MDIVTCNSLTEVEDTIKYKYTGTDWVFRGLPDYTYYLQTRIEHKFNDKIKANNSTQRMIVQFEKLLVQNGIQNEIYRDDFEFKTPNFRNDWYLLCQAQHIGIPTLLMDWSIDWKKALFFSTFDIANEHKSGSLWCFDVNGFSFNDDHINSIYDFSPFDYWGKPRIINPSFGEGAAGKLPMERIRFQDGRFFITSLNDSIKPLENQDCYKNRLTKMIITPECKADIIEKYCTPIEVPLIFSGHQGTYCENGKWFKKYDHKFFYGFMNEELLKVVNQVRKIEEFPEINN
jgi:hypothetical protein